MFTTSIRSLARLACIIGTLFCSTAAFAQENIIRERFREKVVPGEKTISVKKTPFAGLYEVRAGNQIVYTDSKANYLFIGRVIDIESHKDYTQERMEQINVIRFSDLPLEHAIKRVHGKGERVIAVFADPNCGYCKHLEEMLQGVDNLTTYTFPLNILSERSRDISRNVWCSPNRSKAWNAWMVDGVQPPQATNDCVYSDEITRRLAAKYGITGTPVIFFKNGSRITGMPPAEEFAKALSVAR
jgi:thiol:disulfide interchange protein DsbC